MRAQVMGKDYNGSGDLCADKGGKNCPENVKARI